MRNRIIGLLTIFVGLACGWATVDSDRRENYRQAAMPFRECEPADQHEGQASFNQQYSGWTFGRMLGVSIGPKDAPPPPVFGVR